MKVAIVAAEISPWAKVGGLADVVGALPAAFRRAGAEPAVILPGYSSILTNLSAKQVGSLMTLRVDVATHQIRVLSPRDAHRRSAQTSGTPRLARLRCVKSRRRGR